MESKQTSVEEVAIRIENIQKEEWQQERNYSEEDMKEAFNGFKSGKSFTEWFEQFKKK